MIILYRQQKFINLYKIINFTRMQMLNLSLHIGHKKVQWSKHLSLFVVGFRAGVVLISLDYALLYMRRAFAFLDKVLYFYGRVFSISNFVNVGFGGLSQYFLNKKRIGLVGHYDGYYMGGLVSNFFKIRKAKKRFKFEFVRKFTRFKYRLPSIFFIFDASEHFLCYKEASFIGIPSIGFIDSDLDFQHALYPIVANDESIVANIYVLMIVSYFVKVNRYKRRLRFFQLWLKFFMMLLKYSLFFFVIKAGFYVKFREFMLEKREFDMYGYLYNWGIKPYTMDLYYKIPDVDIKKMQDTSFVYAGQLFDKNIAPGVWEKTYMKIYKFLIWFLKRRRFRYKRYRRWLMYFYTNYRPTKTQVSNFSDQFFDYYYSIKEPFINQADAVWWTYFNGFYKTTDYLKYSVIDMFVKRLFRPVYYYKYAFFLRLLAFKYGFQLVVHRIYRIFNERHTYKKVFKYLGMKGKRYIFFEELNDYNFSVKYQKYKEAFDFAWRDFWDVRLRSKYLIFTVVFYFYRSYIFDFDLFFKFKNNNRKMNWFNRAKNPQEKKHKALYGRFNYLRRRFWRFTSLYFFFFIALYFWFFFLRKYRRRVFKRLKIKKKNKGYFLYDFAKQEVIPYDNAYRVKIKKKPFKKKGFIKYNKYNKFNKYNKYNKYNIKDKYNKKNNYDKSHIFSEFGKFQKKPSSYRNIKETFTMPNFK